MPAIPKKEELKSLRRAALQVKGLASKKAALRDIKGIKKQAARKTGKTGTTLEFDGMLGALDGVLSSMPKKSSSRNKNTRISIENKDGSNTWGNKNRTGQTHGAVRRSNRSQELTAREEIDRAAQVAVHPVFLADPLAAIESHFGATMPSPPPPTFSKTKQRRRPKKKGQHAQSTALLQLDALSL